MLSPSSSTSQEYSVARTTTKPEKHCAGCQSPPTNEHQLKEVGRRRTMGQVDASAMLGVAAACAWGWGGDRRHRQEDFAQRQDCRHFYRTGVRGQHCPRGVQGKCVDQCAGHTDGRRSACKVIASSPVCTASASAVRPVAGAGRARQEQRVDTDHAARGGALPAFAIFARCSRVARKVSTCEVV